MSTISRGWACSAAVILVGTVAAADDIHISPSSLAARFGAFTFVAGARPGFVYASPAGTLHFLTSTTGPKPVKEVATRETWTPITRLLAADLDRDGQDEVVCTTLDCRILVLRGTNLEEIWSTPKGKYGCISALTVGDVDSDSEQEIVFVADDRLRVSSGMQDTDEWRPEFEPRQCTKTDIAMGDLDGDGREEIVIGTGLVLTQPFLHAVWEFEPGFGERIDLVDIDGDGKLDILGLGQDGLVRVFDFHERRLKWN